MKPPKLGTIYTAEAKIQIIGPDNRWVTVETCMDTPRAIMLHCAAAVNAGYDFNTLWVRGHVTDRIMAVDFFARQRG